MRAGLAGILMALAGTAGGTAQANAAREFDRGMQALTEGNYAEAYCLWKPLAAAGHGEAQYHLGWLYANGNGLAVDVATAIDWWQRAAEQGHADAQFAVALAYTTGEGVRKDLATALHWYLTAARQGHPDARDILVRLNGDPEVDLLERHPEIAQEPWFGWQGSIRRDRINARRGPGTEFEVVRQLDKEAPVRIIGQRDDWLMAVLDNGETAWIYRPLVIED